MPEQSGQDKTEDPTAKRRADAQEKGNVCKSVDLNAVFILFTAILMLKGTAPRMMKYISGFTIDTYRNLTTITVNADSLPAQMADFFGIIALQPKSIILDSSFSSSIMTFLGVKSPCTILF